MSQRMCHELSTTQPPHNLLQTTRNCWLAEREEEMKQKSSYPTETKLEVRHLGRSAETPTTRVQQHLRTSDGSDSAKIIGFTSYINTHESQDNWTRRCAKSSQRFLSAREKKWSRRENFHWNRTEEVEYVKRKSKRRTIWLYSSGTAGPRIQEKSWHGREGRGG